MTPSYFSYCLSGGDLDILSKISCENKSDLFNTIDDFLSLQETNNECKCALTAIKLGREEEILKNKICNYLFGEGFLTTLYRDEEDDACPF